MNKLETRALHVWHGEHHTLKGVDLPVPERQLTVLLGPSGCGKSTLLRCLNRLCDRDKGVRRAGEVLLDGQSVFAPDVDVAALRRRVGMVFQTPSPFPMSVYDNVAYGVRLHGTPSARELDACVEQALREAALWPEVRDRLHKSALALSGGQRQRLCIARALAVGPQVLLFDEPTSALDPLSAARIEQLLLTLRQRRTLVLVTHSLPQAKRLADRVALLWDGELIECGTARRVFAQPSSRRAADYLNG